MTTITEGDRALVARSVASMADMWENVARASDGRTHRWDDAAAADALAPNVVVNRTTVLAPTDAADLAARVDAFYGTRDLPYGVTDPWESLDLEPHGFTVIAAMPCMTLPAGVEGPPPPPGVEIARVEDEDGLHAFKEVLFNGFDLVAWPHSTDALFDMRLVREPDQRLWLARVEGRPAACAVSLVRHGIVGVYLVATLREYRGRGLGEAVSWRAAQADPGLPAVLQASTMGRPVYERMGFRQIGSVPFWVKA